MASIAKDKNGLKRILFFNHDGERKTIRLGKATMQHAAAVKLRVELLTAAKINATAPDDDTSRWVASIGDGLHTKLADHGLVSPRARSETATLAAFVDSYTMGRTDLKARTLIKFRATRNYLVDFLGADCPLRDITPGDADDWRVFLLGKGMSENTVRKHAQIAKQFVTSAIRRRIISSNPFADLKSTTKANPERFYFVSAEEAELVLDACPNAQWQLLFALSRFGGLRCPSEHLALKWGDVDWERGRIIVRSPKTEHHAGKASRAIPLFPELRPYLEQVYDEAPERTEYVITRYRSSNANLRTQLRRIIKRAGLKPWPKLFQNLRSTRETELAEEYPIHVVCEWIGNSQAVAAKHYLQVTEDHFAKAAQKAAHNTTQPVGTERNGGESKCENPDDFDNRRDLVVAQIAEEGLEPPTRGL